MIARDTMHQQQWLAVLEELGGAAANLPVPNFFPQEMEDQENDYNFYATAADGSVPEGRWTQGPSIDGRGEWHLSSGEALSWSDFATRIATAAGAPVSLVQPVPGAMPGWRAPRPTYAALGSERGGAIGELATDIAQVVQRYRNRRNRRDVA